MVKYERGAVITIPKGTLVRYRGATKPAGRTFRVKINHVLSGYKNVPGYPDMPSTVVWSGAGGYWAQATMNDIEGWASVTALETNQKL